MSKEIICPSCKGKGHVLDAIMLMNVMAIPLSVFETNNSDGFTRKECSQCDGDGWIKIGK